MCYKLIDDESGKIVGRSVIWSVTEPDTANFWIDPIKSLPPNVIDPDALLDEMMTLANFGTPLSDIDIENPVDWIPAIPSEGSGRKLRKIGIKNIKKTYGNVTFTPINPSLLKTNNTNIQ